MADIDEVIKALSICVPETQDYSKLECSDCPYGDVCNPNDIVGIPLPLILDIRVLLKESNRSKHGHWIVLQNCSNSGVYCSECMNKMFDRYPMKKKFSQYCGHCGSHNDLQIEVR